MTRTWIDAIYDRTLGDVQDVQSNPDQEAPKGCWNADDLNRIEKNTAYCAEWMLEQHIIRVSPSIDVYENNYWQANMVPVKTDIDRIISNVMVLVELSRSNPAIADDLPILYMSTQPNYVLANQIEYALELMHNQPKLPLTYFRVILTHGIITQIVRDGGTTEIINESTALVAEDEQVTIQGVEYGDYAQYQNFLYWSGRSEDLGLLADDESKTTSFEMPYRDVTFAANFETRIPYTLTITNGYISEHDDPTAESGPSTGQFLPGTQIMIIANRAPNGKSFYEWEGDREALRNLTGATNTNDPSTVILTMPEKSVGLNPKYINSGQHLVTVVNGTITGGEQIGGTSTKWCSYKENVTIRGSVPTHNKFTTWSGDTSYLNDIHSVSQTFSMPDVAVSFEAHWQYEPSKNNIRVIDGYIKKTENQTTTYLEEDANVEERSEITLVPKYPLPALTSEQEEAMSSAEITNYNYERNRTINWRILNWTVEGEGTIGSNYNPEPDKPEYTFTVGDGNAIITANYADKSSIKIRNKNNLNQEQTIEAAQGRIIRVTTNQFDNINNRIYFVGWYKDGTLVTTSTTLEVTMNETNNRIYEARYEDRSCVVTIINKDNLHNTTNYDWGKYDQRYLDTSSNIAGDYILDYVLLNNIRVTGEGYYGAAYVSTYAGSDMLFWTPNADATLEWVYRARETYNVTVVDYEGSHTNTHVEGSTVQITAATDAEHEFSRWTASGYTFDDSPYIRQSYRNPTTITMPRNDVTFTAGYNMRTITVVNNTHPVSNPAVYKVVQGDTIQIDAGTPPSTYEFDHWEITSGGVAWMANSYSSQTDIRAGSTDATITAIYKEIPKFNVTMENAYIYFSGEPVVSAEIYRDAQHTIQMKPAPTGYQFLQWEVYVNDVLQTNTDLVEIYQPLAETTTIKKIRSDCTIKATYYLPNPTVTYTLTIVRKDGTTDQSTHEVGEDVHIIASSPAQGKQFFKWTGTGAAYINNVYNSNALVHMPAQNITIEETYVDEGYIPKYTLRRTGVYGEFAYTTTSTDPETGDPVTTEHWTTNPHQYEAGEIVKIRMTSFDNEYYFNGWSAYNHDTSALTNSIIADLSAQQTTITMPEYDVDIEGTIALKTTYQITLENGLIGANNTSAFAYAGQRVDVRYYKPDTNNVHYEFTRWTGLPGTNIAEIELWDGGIFNPLVPGTEENPIYIKMPNKAIGLRANYKTKYKLTLTNATIDSTSETTGFYEENTSITITADTRAGMTFQHWSGDTTGIANIYDPTTTYTMPGNVANLQAIYSVDAERNSIGYSALSLKTASTVDNTDVTVISGTIEPGFILTDSVGHIYVVTAVESGVSTIYRMTKTLQGGNTYG